MHIADPYIPGSAGRLSLLAPNLGIEWI